jgi:two-component system sensor histidine kinase SenX3
MAGDDRVNSGRRFVDSDVSGPVRPRSGPYHRRVVLLATLVAIAVLLCCVPVGLWLADRRRNRATAPVRDAQRADPVLLGRLVVNALDQAVVVLDRDEQVVLRNHAARQMGVVANDQLVFGDLAELVRAVLATGAPVHASIDLPVARLGREPIALAVRVVPLASGADKRVSAVGLFLTDQTDQRRLDAVRRDFVANVSHELKTPVGALSLLAEAIQDAEDRETVNRFAGRIQHEASRLGRLVDELIELSRVQGADPLPTSRELQVSAVVSEAVHRTEFAAEQAGITVHAVCEPSLYVRGDATQLATAVANLVDNAIAYSGQGTRVAVTAQAEADDDGHPVVDIAVTDQGIGIAEADRNRIFERFYRVEPARSRATGGTGLGLAIVKNVVTNHSGAVSVRSALGAGSTFTIRLPRVQAVASTSDEAGVGQRVDATRASIGGPMPR